MLMFSTSHLLLLRSIMMIIWPLSHLIFDPPDVTGPITTAEIRPALSASKPSSASSPDSITVIALRTEEFKEIRMEVASSWPKHLPSLSASKTSKLSPLVKSTYWWRSGQCRQCCSDFLPMFAGDIEAYHTNSGIVMDCADRNRETPHLGD